MPGPTGPDARILARVWELHLEDRTRNYIALRIAEEFPQQWPEPPSLATITNWVREAARHAEAQGVLDHALEKARHLGVLSLLMSWLADRRADGVRVEVLYKPMLAIMQERAKLMGLYAPTRVEVGSVGPEFDADLFAALGVANEKRRALEPAEQD